MPRRSPKARAHRCSDCGEVKPLGDFPGGKPHSYCKVCNHKRHLATLRKHYGGSTRHYHLKQRHGIGATEFDEMLAAQGGVCRICKGAPAAQVDHDHATGRLRGLLCLDCNAALGAFGDDPEVLARALAYVDRTGDAREALF